VLTPEEIQSREFLVSLRGYDRDEVHAFLDEVAEAFAQLRAQAGVAPAPAPAAAPEPAPRAPEPVAPEPAVSPFAAIGAETQRILEAAQEAGEEIRKRAQAEADTARRDALAEADKAVTALREQAAATQSQIDILEQRRDELADRLRQARETVDLALLEVDGAGEEPEPADARTSVLAAAAADEPPAEPDDEPAAIDPVEADADPDPDEDEDEA
jgi:DivIVA domain-containing protein